MRGSKNGKRREDIVMASLSEIILFFLFFCLILLGSIWAADGLRAQTYAQACGDDPQKCTSDEELLKFVDLCGETSDGCVPVDEYELMREKVLLFTKACGEDPKDCFSRSDLDEVQSSVADYVAACGPESSKCVNEAGLRTAEEDLKAYVDKCGTDPTKCVSPEDVAKWEGVLDSFKDKCGESALGCIDKELFDKVSGDLDKFVTICGDEPKNCMLVSEAEGINARIVAYQNACGDDASACIPDDKLRTAQDMLEASQDMLEAYRAQCGDVPGNCQVKENDEPSSIFLTEGEGYTFNKSKANVTSTFEAMFERGNRLRNIKAGRLKVLEYLKSSVARHGAENVIVEVVGHTDPDPFQGACARGSNLDQQLQNVLQGSRSVNLSYCDNVGLGMARAASAASFLREKLQDDYPKVPIFPLSAGQLQPATFEMIGNGIALSRSALSSAEKKRRRRIEIRVSIRNGS